MPVLSIKTYYIVEDIRWKPLWLIIAFLFFCIFIWLTSSLTTALIVLAIGLSIYAANHLYWLNRLYCWLAKPVPAKIPQGFGIWEDVFSALYKEQRKINRDRTQLSTTLARFKHAASALPDGIVVLNAQHEIEWCNEPAEFYLGIKLISDVSQPINYLIRDQDFVSYLNSYEYDESIRLKSTLNESILEFKIITYGTKQKLLICRDVTQLEKIDTMRRDFIANVSHELRTPLTVVGGFLETLNDIEGAIPDTTQHYFDMMQEQTSRMRLLIDDLLLLSKIESNTQAPDSDIINIVNQANQLQNDAQGLSLGKHTITLEIDPDLHLIGATREIQSAMSNLLSNAIRYSPDGGIIHITWSLIKGAPVFSVQDHGIGIEAKHIDRLEERFYRVDRGRSRLTGGTGLGLSIVKHILTRHQARLSIESEVGKGSTFSITFPKSRIARVE